VKISENDDLSLDVSSQKEISNFLSEPNNVYVNHSTSILTADIEEYGEIKTVNKFLLISIIYKDLNDSEYNLKKTSKKIKKVVTKEIEAGQKIKEPEVETDFDKGIRKINIETKKAK
jgi:hypothetical protein